MGNLLAVHLAVTPENSRMGVAVCLSPLRDVPNTTTTLGHYVNLLSSLGAAHFFIYTPDSPKRTRFYRTLRRRFGTPLVTPISWRPPTSDVWNGGQLLAHNDCLYRAANKGFRYAITSDLDEVLVPRGRGFKSWLDVVAALEREDSQCAGFTFSRFTSE